ncbi:MAG TPA: TIGR01777 family oxidoreductase [Gemmatales bacterium]|nr:TIGR01777 family oxidoreductase [Gemmatales bacterium]
MSPLLSSQRIVIAGGSGFLGISLAAHLTARGASVVILSRRPSKVKGNWKHVTWDARTLGDWRHELAGATGLVNLTGRTVDCRKTPDHQDEILRSRVESTQVLGQALRSIESPPPVWVQMSTAHIYGDPPEVVCSEDSAPGYGLAPFVGKAWEEAYRSSVLPTQRQVILRTSFVLGRDRGAGGGAFSTLRSLTRWGLGGTVGSGRQGMSWIHEADMNQLFERALLQKSMQGMYIASAPHPLSQREFMKCLRQAMGMPIGLPAFSWMVRFGARWILNTDPDLVLYGRSVVPKRLLAEGFVFAFPALKEAMFDLLK